MCKCDKANRDGLSLHVKCDISNKDGAFVDMKRDNTNGTKGFPNFGFSIFDFRLENKADRKAHPKRGVREMAKEGAQTV